MLSFSYTTHKQKHLQKENQEVIHSKPKPKTAFYVMFFMLIFMCNIIYDFFNLSSSNEQILDPVEKSLQVIRNIDVLEIILKNKCNLSGNFEIVHHLN